MSTILVTAATGNVGSALVPLLQGLGADVRALVRDPARAERLTGVDVAVGDFADPTSLHTALDGVDAVFLACGNVPDQVEHECAVIDAAARAGVRRIVKLSARGAELGAPVAYWHWHALVERRLQASGVPAVTLRPGFLMSNLLGAADQVRHARMLFAPAADARIAMVDPADVAAVAAVTLTTDGHDGVTYELTGPAALGYQEVARDLAAVTGRDVGYVDIPPAAARSAMVEAGLPPFAADQVVAVFAELRAGVQARTTDAVPALTGRPARPFAAFARDHADAFRAHEPAPVH